MYTIDDENKEEVEEEFNDNNFWSNNRGLVIKIIIIILCIIVLIWLFKALKTRNNVKEDESIHIANVEKVRLAAEGYFFVKNNKSDDTKKLVNLNELGLSGDVIDANNKVCNGVSSTVALTPQSDAYKMNIKLACSTNDKEEEFLYHTKTLACLNCDGHTIMTGINEEKEEIEEKDEGNKNDDYVVPVSNDESSEYSCVNWSSWTKKRENESFLEERSKTLVQGVKYGNTDANIIYGEWSEFTTTPIEENDGIEVETKVVHEENWSEPKTATSLNENDPKIKVISVESVMADTKSCENGYVLNNVCYSNETIVGNLTLKEYNSGKYNIKNGRCERVMTLKNNEGKYVLTYANCEYNEILNENITNDVSYNIYTYQELVDTDVTYYRSRTKTIENDDTNPIYTENKYEEAYLPDGFVKVPGTEETYYSYKIATCEK